MPETCLATQIDTIARDANGSKTVAFFDLDRTLIAGYSVIAIAWERVRHGLTRGELRESTAILRELLGQGGAKGGPGGSRYDRLVKRLSRSLKGISEETLTQLGEQAYRNILARNVYSEAISLIEAHRRAGHHLVIVTAATRYQVEPIARVLGIHEVCCTGLEVVAGKFTGRTLAPLCYGEGKAMAAMRVCRSLRARQADSYFYTDSIDDLPLLKKVGNPVVVNPSEKLAVYARDRDWPSLQFDTRGMPSAESLIRTALTLQTVVAGTAASALLRRLSPSRAGSGAGLSNLAAELGCGFAGIDLEVEGADHLVGDQPAVYVFNHQSMLDGMLLAHLLRKDVVALCKQEMRDNPLVGALLQGAGTIFVERDKADQSQVLRQALAVLGKGGSLLIAPEGTRSTLGEIQPFKHGAFLLAKKARVPVIPIVLHNVKDALPNGGLVIRPATVRVSVLPPMHPALLGGVRMACEQLEREYCRVLGESVIAALPYAARAGRRTGVAGQAQTPKA